MQIKPTMRYCLIFGRIAIINKTRNKKCWQERTLVHCWCVYKVVQQYGNSIKILQKLKNETTIQFSNSASGYFSRINKNTNLKKIPAPSCSPQHYFQQPRLWKQPKRLSIDEWIKKNVMCVYTYMHIDTHTHIHRVYTYIQSVQLLSCVQLFAFPWAAVCQGLLSITNSKSLFKLMSIKLVMPSIHLILCFPLNLLLSIFPSIRVFLMNQFFSSGGQTIGVSASASSFQ